MTSFLTHLVAFAARHWLRLLIIGFAVVLFSRKQVNFNVRLGSPAPVETPASGEFTPAESSISPPTTLSDGTVPGKATETVAKPGFFERFNLFSSGDDFSYYDRLSRLEEREIAVFLRRFSNVAQAEQDKFGIPSSITLATALLYGKAGLTDAATEYNSYFGMPCSADWPGATARAEGRCHRAYETAWTSFRDFSLYVTSGKYAALQQFGNKDYRRWAAGLEELSFNETEELAEQLLRTIDRYQLFRFD